MNQSISTQKTCNEIVHCALADLQPGKLGELFCNGTKAAVLTGDLRIQWLWDNLIELKSLGQQKNGEAVFPWESSIGDIARNHEPGNIYTGDMLRFTPGALGHIARKVIVFKDANNQLGTIPKTFMTHHGELPLSQQVIETVWEVIHDVLKSSLPEHNTLKDYAVKIDILKYPSCIKEFDSILTLLGDSSGYWTRKGMQIDRTKAMAVEMFDKKYIRDIFAVGTLFPGIGSLLSRVNSFFMKYSKKKTSFNKMLIGEPHVDGPNILTCLISDRDSLSTEVHHKGHWVELPLSTKTLAFFPSKKICEHSTSRPTVHRILIDRQDRHQKVSKSNITVNFSVISWPTSSGIA